MDRPFSVPSTIQPSVEANTYTYSETTADIEIRVRPEFLPRQSRPDQHMFTWAYHVSMLNKGSKRVQLQSRHWLITDGLGRLEEVYGAGVIGEQPILVPGASFAYSSGCPLRTTTGNMRGWYEFVDLDSCERMKVRIPLFFLRSPEALH
jgi:ApaG protein